MSTINLVQSDTGPDLDITLSDRNTGSPVDVSGATVRLYFRKKGATTLTATITLTKPNGGGDGLVRVIWPAGSLSVPGSYEGEIEITSGSKITTLFQILDFFVRPQIG